MLTVDYDRLGVRPGDRLLDLGCGGGRHAFEAVRRQADVVALDADAADLKDAAARLAELVEGPGEAPGEAPGNANAGRWAAAVNGDARSLPFSDGTFDRVIVAEVLEHVPDDERAVAELTRVLRPGGTLAATVPRWFPEKVCWVLSDDYHAPAVPGGHVRIYRRAELVERLRAAGLEVDGWDHVHALHSPYWWLRCALGPQRDGPLPVRLYHRFLVWDLMKRPRSTRLLERALDPVLGKSLVVYAHKPDR